MPRRTKAPETPDPTTLKRESAGTYRTPDGRFTVQEASGRWMVLDGEEHDELGLPLTRGPYETLADARAAVAEARTGPAPESKLAKRLAATPRHDASGSTAGTKGGRGRAATQAPPRSKQAAPKEPPPIEVRRYRHGDGAELRSLWTGIGLESIGDDDESLDRMAERNPGLLIVATQEERIVASALGAWDGRRGWIYHVGTAVDHRDEGLARRLVQEVERKLRQLGCPKVNVVVRDENPDGATFWEAMGYTSPPSRQFGKEI